MSQTVVENGFQVEPGFEWGAIDKEAVRRVGVIDVGSNSVRLVVFDGVARSPAYFYNEKILCGLGVGLSETGRLNADGRARALLALRRFAALADRMQLSSLTGVATAAVREAEDGPAFVSEVRKTLGLQLHVASGAEEAELSSKGVVLGWPHATGLVCDIGGASMELAQVEDGVIGARDTSPLGPLKLAGLEDDAAVEKAIRKGVKRLVKSVATDTRKIYLVGGSWRAIARLDMERRAYPLKVLHEYRMSPGDVIETCEWVATQAPEDLRAMTDTSLARLELVPLAARVLAELVARVQPKSVSVSSYGLREGMLYEMMPESLRGRDPLLEASGHMEQTRARFPGFGLSLFGWLQPIYAGADEEEMRLVQAACHLHDITWRSHPDYRHEVCFETVTRANLSGLDHTGRVFLGLAILNRYKSGAHSQFDADLLALLDEDEKGRAVMLGKAIRLGAMLSGAAPGSLENTRLEVDETHVRLHLMGSARDLRGESVERRLHSLAGLLNRSGEIVLEPAA